jgi:hypothetical protein
MPESMNLFKPPKDFNEAELRYIDGAERKDLYVSLIISAHIYAQCSSDGDVRCYGVRWFVFPIQRGTFFHITHEFINSIASRLLTLQSMLYYVENIDSVDLKLKHVEYVGGRVTPPRRESMEDGDKLLVFHPCLYLTPELNVDIDKNA